MVKQNQLKALLKEKIQSRLVNNDMVSLYLFGSYAWGTPNVTSDIDLLVIAQDNPHALVKDLYKSFSDLEFDIDILGYKKNQIKSKSKYNPFLKKILTEGKVIYGTRL